MVHIHIVQLGAVPCKIIDRTNGCCKGKYVVAQTSQNCFGPLIKCLKLVYLQPNIWLWQKRKWPRIAMSR